MNTPLKDNAHVHANPAAFMEAYRRARTELERIPGVLGVGYGHVSKAGEFRVGIGFQVFVHEKRPEPDLPAGERIPRSFEGYRVDVRAAQVLREFENNPDYHDGAGYDARESPIVGGIQIEPRKKSLPPTAPCMAAGTLGCIVRRRHKGDGDDNVYLLTNAHVLEAEGCKVGDYVYQPYASKTSDPKPGTWLGAVADILEKKDYLIDNDATYLDCGIARIEVDAHCCECICGPPRVPWKPLIKGIGSAGAADGIVDVRDLRGDTSMFVNVPRDPNDGNVLWDDDATLESVLTAASATAPKVRKMGRSSGLTVGIVLTTHGFGYSNVFGNLVTIHNFLEIMLDPVFSDGRGPGKNRNGKRSFSDEGDSGSIVLDAQNNAVGLLFGGPPLSQRVGSAWGVTWASHIVPVLDQLDIYIPTKDGAGTHHGSDGALADLTLPRSKERVAPGNESFFTSAGRTSPGLASTAAAEPDLHGFADRLRASEAGAQLYAFLTAHQREIGYLVRNSRPVTVAWHRHAGPAFLAQILNHLRGDAPRMPLEIRGIRRRVLLVRLRTALMSHGSYELQRALEQHGDLILALAEAETFDECLEVLA